MSWTWTTAGVLAFLFLIQTFFWRRNAKYSKRLPPGPRGFPIFGSLHLLGKYPHRDLHKLAQNYGPIMHLRLGLKPTIVVSSPRAAEQFLRTHDLVFASRPPHEASKYISYNQKNIIYAEYGSYWRTVRKMCTLELLSNHKINSFKSMRREELQLLIDYVKEVACPGNNAVDLSAKVLSLNADMTCRMVFGKKYMEDEFDERGFKAVMEEVVELVATFNMADYIPQIAALDLQGLTKRMKAVAKVFDEFIEKVIDEHVRSRDENRTKDFVDLMLSFMGSEETEYRINREHIKAIILDMLAAAMDTSAATIEWALSELIKHPEIMKKVQKELENVVGKHRMVEESDLENLKYLDMVIKETFRFHAVVPFLIHASREDCTVEGFHIPEKSRIFINAWAIGRDPNAWNDPEKFYPERFMENNVDLRGHDFQLIPFGSGRRICLGMQLGITVVRLVTAQLVHCFDWELPGGMVANELDMTERFGIVMGRAEHLWAIPTYRLDKS